MLNVPYLGLGFYVNDLSLSGVYPVSIRNGGCTLDALPALSVPKASLAPKICDATHGPQGIESPCGFRPTRVGDKPCWSFRGGAEKKRNEKFWTTPLLEYHTNFPLNITFFLVRLSSDANSKLFLEISIQKNARFFLWKSDVPFWSEGIGEWYEQLNFKFRSGGVGRTGQNDPGREQEIGGQVVTRYVYFWILSVWQYDYICMYIYI